MEAIRSYFSGEYRIRLLIGIIFPLFIADGVISHYLVINGLGTEANPFLRSWVADPSFLTVKLLTGVFIPLILWDIYKRHPRLSIITTTFFMIFYTVIVYWNIIIYINSVIKSV